MNDPAPTFRKAKRLGILDGWYGPHLQPFKTGPCYTITPVNGPSHVKMEDEAIDYAMALEASGMLDGAHYDER
jgi:hypothetical protein